MMVIIMHGFRVAAKEDTSGLVELRVGGEHLLQLTLTASKTTAAVLVHREKQSSRVIQGKNLKSYTQEHKFKSIQTQAAHLKATRHYHKSMAYISSTTSEKLFMKAKKPPSSVDNNYSLAYVKRIKCTV